MYRRVDRFPTALRPYAHGSVSFFALPSVYGAAPLVLDDLQEVNRAFGNLNSRIYESLACGALPIANARAGLDETGLADLSVAESAEELRDLVLRHRAEPAVREALVARLRDVVLARHTDGARAATLHDLLHRELPVDARGRRRSPSPPTTG